MIEPTTTTVVRATAEPARDKSAEQTSNDDFQETLDRASAIEPTQAVPAPDVRKIEPEPGPMRTNDAPGPQEAPPNSAAAQVPPADAGPLPATFANAPSGEIKPGRAPIAPAQPGPLPATARTGVDQTAGVPHSGPNPTRVDPRAARPVQHHPARPPLHQALRPTAPREALDPATRASVELTAAAPTRAMTAAALARAAADRPAGPPTPESASPEGGTVTNDSLSSERAHRSARLTAADPTRGGPAEHAAPTRREPPQSPEQPPAASAQSAPQRNHEQPPPPSSAHAPAFQPAAAATSNAAIGTRLAASAVSAAAPTTKAQPAGGTAARIGLAPITAKAPSAQASRRISAPAPAAEPPAAQFARGLAAALRQNGGTVTLHLRPQELGELTIRMQISQGSVEARFEAATDQARGLLNESIDTLRAALEAKGLEVDRLSVHVAERHAEHAAQDAPPRDAGDSGPGHGGHDRPGHGPPRNAARRPQPDPGEELPEIPHAWAEPYAGLGGAPRLDAIA